MKNNESGQSPKALSRREFIVAGLASSAAALLAACGSAAQAPVTSNTASSAPARPASSAAGSTSPPGSPAASAVAASASASPSVQPASGLPPLKPAVKVRLGSQNLNQEGPRLYAMDRGYFAAEGLDIDVIPIAQGNDIMQAVATNQIDIATTGYAAVALNMVQRGLGVKIVFGDGIFAPGKRTLVFMVRKDLYESGKVRGFQDLKGRTVAVAVPGSAAHFWLDEQLKAAKMTEADIDRKTLSFPDQLVAFSNKGIDAAVMVEPFGATAEQKGMAVFVRNFGDDYPNMAAVAGWASPNFIKSQDVFRRYVFAWWRGAQDWNKVWLPAKPDPQQVQQSVDMGKKYGVNINALAPAVLSPDGLPHVETMTALVAFFRQFAKIPGNATFEPAVDDSVIRQVVQKLGQATA